MSGIWHVGHDLMDLKVKRKHREEYSNRKKMDIKLLKATKWAFEFTTLRFSKAIQITATCGLAYLSWRFATFGQFHGPVNGTFHFLSVAPPPPPPPNGRHFFVVSSRSLSESVIFASIEGVGIAILLFYIDPRNPCLSQSLYSNP